MLAPVSERLRRFLGDVVVSQAEIAAAVKSLAQRIEDFYLPGDFGIVPILPKSSVFCTDLLRSIRIPVRVISAVVGTQEINENSLTINCRVFSDEASLPSRLLILNTVADATTDELFDIVAETLVSHKEVTEVRCCALIKTSDCKPKKKENGFVDSNIHFSGLELDAVTQRFVGYGLTYKSNFAQLPCLINMRKEF